MKKLLLAGVILVLGVPTHAEESLANEARAFISHNFDDFLPHPVENQRFERVNSFGGKIDNKGDFQRFIDLTRGKCLTSFPIFNRYKALLLVEELDKDVEFRFKFVNNDNRAICLR